MGRTNKSLQGAFTSIAGTSTERSAMEQFISRITEQEIIPGQYSLANPSDEEISDQYSLANLITEYQIKSKNSEPTVNELATIETLIMQLKTRHSNLDDVKLYFNRKKYIYARCPFYRSSSEIHEIRVIIGLISNFITDPKNATQATLDELAANNGIFMGLVRLKISEAMDKEIELTKKSYDILKNNLEYSK